MRFVFDVEKSMLWQHGAVKLRRLSISIVTRSSKIFSSFDIFTFFHF